MASGWTFTDRHGTVHPLDETLRDRLKPGWRAMVKPDPRVVPSDRVLAQRLRGAASLVQEARAMVATLAGRQISGRVLEVGCYDGAVAFELSRDPAVEVTASDLVRYYVVQEPGRLSGDAEQAQQARLDALRGRIRHAAGVPADAVRFIEDDITASRVEPSSLDAVLSFEVLEHLADPGAAFAATARLLVPGGIAYHVYNPFFSLIGGHSLCTLDFPWGHARLHPDDVERYITEMRPAEAEHGRRFYTESLNRMTIDELRRHVSAANLELLALVAWPDHDSVARLTPAALAETRAIYSTVTAEDLIASFVTVLARRPAAVSESPQRG